MDTKIKYVVEHIALGAVLGYDLAEFLPKFIRIAAFDVSIVRLVISMILCCTIGICLTWNDRNWRHVCQNTAAGLGVYVAWNFIDYLPNGRFRVMMIAAVCVALAGMSLAAAISRKSNQSDKIQQSKVRSGLRTAWLGASLMAFTACIFMPIPVKCTDDAEIKSIYYEKTGYNSDDAYEMTVVYGDEYSMDNNMEIIKNIDSEIWQTLSDEEKKKTLKAVAYSYANDQGMGSWMDISFVDEKLDDEYGKYVYGTDKSQIYISMECLSDAETAIETVIHQVYHVYQEEMCELYISATPSQRSLRQFRNCDVYVAYLKGDPLLGYEDEDDADKFESYAKVEGDYEAYYYQNHAYEYLNPAEDREY